MVNDILDAVTIQLGTVFGSEYKYYIENVEQKLSKPCFTIDMVLPLQRSRSPVLYDRTMPLVIHYFAKDKKDTKKECYGIAEQLNEALEYLPFKGSFLRGEDISWQIVEDVLQLFVTYRFMTRKVTDGEINMTDLKSATKAIN